MMDLLLLDIHNLQYKNIINIDVPLAIYQLYSYHNNHIQIFAIEAAGLKKCVFCNNFGSF